MREGEPGRFCVGNGQLRYGQEVDCGTEGPTSGRASTWQARVPEPPSGR
jgi:hypothetical protein